MHFLLCNSFSFFRPYAKFKILRTIKPIMFLVGDFRHNRHAYRTYINSTLFCFLVSCISGFCNFWYLSMAITLNLFTLQCTLPPRDKTRCDVISHYQGFRQEQDHPQKCRSFLCLPYYQVYTVA